METRTQASSEKPRHPFRAGLDPAVVAPLSDVRARDDGDVKLFLLSFAAFFFVFYSFIF